MVRINKGNNNVRKHLVNTKEGNSIAFRDVVKINKGNNNVRRAFVWTGRARSKAFGFLPY